MAQALLRTCGIFTAALVGRVGGVAAGVGLAVPLDILINHVFSTAEARQRERARQFCHCLADELAVVGPNDEGTRNAVCLKIETAVQRFPITHRRLVELNLDPDAAMREVAARLDFANPAERTELEDWCKRLIRTFYDKLPRHAHILAEMLPDLWAVALRRLGDLQELVGTLAANDTERRDLQAEVNRLRADGHILDRAIITLLQDVGERIGDPSRYPDQLRRAGERYQELLAEAERPRNLPPEFEAVRQEAARLIREGRLDEADAVLMELDDGMAAWEADQEAMLQQGKRHRASVRAERAQIAKTRLRYRDAATLLAEAADLTAFDPETSWRHRLVQGNVLQDLGREFGDNAALIEAIATYEQALDLAPRDTRPDDWATTQNNLGNALQTLGERASGTATLERAVEAFEAALLEHTPERVPLHWATTQNNLGNALAALGERESRTTTLERAVEAYKAALRERNRELVQLDWAVIQNNLGSALLRLGERETGTATLERAVEAYETALLEYTRERVPLKWAGTQNNLGEALRTLGARENGTATLERAVEAFEAALLERTRQRVPLDWAMTQNNLGNALATLADRESGTATFELAVDAYEAALLERTRERVPLDWATTQNNLGAALVPLGKRESDTATLERAVEAYEAALLERTRERVPFLWALTQENVALARLVISARRDDAGELQAALVAVDGALGEYRAGKAVFYIEKAERLRGYILAALAEHDG